MHKIIHDPIYGVIDISNSLIFQLIYHRYFQRLQFIKQTGLISIVYPGANHTRFHHAIGSMYLMKFALKIIKNKGIKINYEEEISALIAILLHDIGHGPLSHTLEFCILKGMHHENISKIYFDFLNKEFKGELEMAIDMFNNKYKRKFFHQLINSQLDVDRLDYLKRDSFFTGVSEGNISSEKLLRMLNVINDELVVEATSIYFIEKYLISRIFMYCQVYFNKISLSAELLLMKIFIRVKKLILEGIKVDSTDYLSYFLSENKYSTLYDSIEKFTFLGDTDIYISLKKWQFHQDKILSLLSKMILYKKLPYSRILNIKLPINNIQKYIKETENIYNITDGSYFVNQKKIKIIPYEKKIIQLNY